MRVKVNKTVTPLKGTLWDKRHQQIAAGTSEGTGVQTPPFPGARARRLVTPLTLPPHALYVLLDRKPRKSGTLTCVSQHTSGSPGNFAVKENGRHRHESASISSAKGCIFPS